MFVLRDKAGPGKERLTEFTDRDCEALWQKVPVVRRLLLAQPKVNAGSPAAL